MFPGFDKPNLDFREKKIDGSPRHAGAFISPSGALTWSTRLETSASRTGRGMNGICGCEGGGGMR